jgi:drug/metabolite transporter (DMT)-like permease
MPGPGGEGDDRRGLALVVVSAAAYATMPIFAKVAFNGGLPAVDLLAWRFVLAVGLFAVLGRGRPALPFRVRLRLWGLGLVFVGNSLAYFLALERVPASLLTLLLYTYPVIVTLLAAAFGIDRLTPRSLAAAALSMGGAALTVGSFATAPLAGVLLSLTAALVYSAYIVLSSRFAAGVPSEAAAAHVAQTALVAYLGAALWRGELLSPVSPGVWLAVLGISLISTVVALRAFMAGLARIGPSRAAVLSSLEVVFILALAASLLGEPLTPRLLLGAALILSAVLLQHGRPARENR